MECFSGIRHPAPVPTSLHKSTRKIGLIRFYSSGWPSASTINSKMKYFKEQCLLWKKANLFFGIAFVICTPSNPLGCKQQAVVRKGELPALLSLPACQNWNKSYLPVHTISEGNKREVWLSVPNASDQSLLWMVPLELNGIIVSGLGLYFFE